MMDDTASDSLLLGQFVSHQSEDAFAQIVARHGAMVLGVCRRILQNPADAEDAAQATFIALALKAGRVSAGGGLAGWLHHVGRHVALDMHKANARRQRRSEDFQVLDPGTASPDAESCLPEVDTAVSALPAKLRTAVIQNYFEGLPIETIAHLHGCSPSAISMRLTRARELLRKKLPRRGAAYSLEALLDLALRRQKIPIQFAHHTARKAAIASSGATASEAATASLVAAARETLRKLAFTTLRWPAVAAALSVGMVCVVIGAGDTSTPAPLRRRPSLPPVAGPGLPREDPPLIAALARIDRWSDLPTFKAALDQVSGNVDAVRDAEAKTTLHRAARLGYTETMTLLLRRGADVNAVDAQGRTPLFEAVFAGSQWAIEVLALWGAEIDHRALDGSTALTDALVRKDRRSAEVLLWLGARTRLDDVPPEKQPLAIAEASGDAKLLTLVKEYDDTAGLTLGVKPREIPHFVKDAMHDAARRADFIALENSLRNGLDINQLDDQGKTPLHRAIAGGHGEMVFYLLLLGANANLPDRAGVSPFMESLAWMGDGAGNAARLFLIAKDANPNAVRNDGHTELTWAADRDNEHALQWLLWMGADVRAPARVGTPFQVAWRGGHKHILDVLRSNGIEEPTQMPADPAELLQIAVKLGDDDLVIKAVWNCAPLNDANKDGNSPLMVALLHRNIGTARLLIEHGADIHFQNPVNHQTPLCSTLPWNGSEVNQLRRDLLDAGADVNIKTKKMRSTPLMMALIHGPWLLQELVAYGADVQARDKDGLTVLGQALKNGQKDSVDYLRGIGATE